MAVSVPMVARPARSVLSVVVAVCLCVLTVVGTVRGDTGRDSNAQTGWTYYTGIGTAQINDLINNQNQRLITLKRDVASGTYTVTTVTNTGQYAQSWWWYVNIDATALANFIAANNARLISIDVFDNGAGATRFNVVMVSNTGVNNKLWWYYYGVTVADITGFINANNARIVDLHSYTIGGQTRYAVIMIRNTGADARAWYWYVNADPATVSAQIAGANQRLIDLQVVNDNPFRVNAVMEQSQGQGWWWFYGVSLADLGNFPAQYAARVFDFQPYATAAGTRYALLMLDNADARTLRMRNILVQSDGFSGAYLKQVNGPVLSAIQPDRVFEPASSIKALHHTHAMLRVQAGATMLTTPGNVFLGTVGSCPQDTGPISEQLQTSLRLMMENSDNNRTQAMRVRFGEAAINGTAASLGMGNTLIRHRLGCAGGADGAIAEPNQFTLRDAGTLYEAVANGLLNPTNRATFYSLMSDSEGNGIPGDLNAIMDQEAAAAGMPVALRNEFKDLFRSVNKGGNYSLSTGGPAYFHQTRAGWVSIPFKVPGNCANVNREFVHGAYVNNASNDGAAATAASGAFAEILRDSFRAGIDSWNACQNVCRADFNGDGNLDPDDLSDFITCFFLDVQFPGTCAGADFNADGFRDPDDLADFITAFFLRC